MVMSTRRLLSFLSRQTIRGWYLNFKQAAQITGKAYIKVSIRNGCQKYLKLFFRARLYSGIGWNNLESESLGKINFDWQCLFHISYFYFL